MEKTALGQRISKFEIIGIHVKKYRIVLSIALSVFILSLIGLIIYWFFDPNDVNFIVDHTYLVSQIVIAVISIGMLVVLFLTKYDKIKIIPLAVICHVYAFLLMLWAAGTSIMDLKIGLSPILYLIVATLVSSLFILEPIFFTAISLSAFLSIMICHGFKEYSFFSGEYEVENIMYFTIYAALVIVISFRHYNVTMREHKALSEIKYLSYHDELTSLLNERSYVNKAEEINNSINRGDIKPFAIVLMDVNNLKATNDKYGHRYGCHLVVRTGHTLPDIFKTSSLYHIGGDEFLAVIEGEDYENFDNLIKLFDETCRYSLIEYEGKELIFSVARGYSKYQEGDLFKDVLQRADDMMYKNKAEIKKAYNMQSR